MTDKTGKEVEIINVGPLGAREEVGEFIGQIGAKALGFMFILIVGSFVIIIRHGVSVRSILFLVGPIVSAAGLIAFNRFVIEFAATGVSKRGWIHWLNTMGAWLPYVFGCYLFFYEGLWQIVVLFRSFTLTRLLAALFCMVAGYTLVTAIHRATEFADGLFDGRILIRTENGDVVPPALQDYAMKETPSYASFWIRVGAYCIDIVVMVIPLNLLTFFLNAVTPPDSNTQLGIALIVWCLYFAILESSAWQGTVGKKLLGLIVTDLSGKRITFGRAIGRYFAKLLSFLLVIGVTMVLWTQKKQGLHDIMAGTLVLKKSKKPPTTT